MFTLVQTLGIGHQAALTAIENLAMYASMGPLVKRVGGGSEFPVMALPDGQFVRTVDVGRVIGTTTLKDGGIPTSVIKVFTDKAGNLITTFPVKAGN